MTPDRPTITLRPDPVQWRGAVRPAVIPAPDADDRRALGLPTDRPIIMSGHQPTLWHAGILAKLLAAGELARATGAHAATAATLSAPAATQVPVSSLKSSANRPSKTSPASGRAGSTNRTASPLL